MELSSYQTKTNRRKLVGAYSAASPLVSIQQVLEDGEFLLTASNTRMLLIHSGAISPKSTRNTQGVAVMTLKRNHFLEKVAPYQEGSLSDPNRYRTKSLPAAGALPKAAEQTTLG